jgi:hypothetical protein
MGAEVEGGLHLQLSEAGADEEHQDALTRQFREELLTLDDVYDVSFTRQGAVPDAARAVDAATVEGLVVAVGAAAQGLQAVLALVAAWRARGQRAQNGQNPDRTARVQIGGDVLELRGSLAEDRTLIELFVQQHAGQA